MRTMSAAALRVDVLDRLRQAQRQLALLPPFAGVNELLHLLQQNRAIGALPPTPFASSPRC